ncbi:hypothetical protein DL96DRAFT_1629465 [Flagelloscypha sp. PMI_526]|nr:hypothetical protein DL96DRAFT_1629465 [Flagelloscypha sp. PMI_526]
MSRFLPPELQGQILQQAAQAQSKAETLDWMLVSHMAYDRKGTTFWASRLRGLCVRITYNSDPDALPTSPLWTKLFSDVIPHLANLQYFEGLGSPGRGAQRLAIGQTLVTSISTLPNLTYFAANNDVLPDSSTQDLPLFHSVTHLKRFNLHTVTLHILRFLRSFPNLTHFLTPISTFDLEKMSSLAEKLSHLMVLALARRIYYKNDIPTFKEIAGNGSNDVWALCEEEILERSGK